MADSERRARLDAHPDERASLLLLAHATDDGSTAYCRDHLTPGNAIGAAPIVVLSEDAVDRPALRDAADRSGVVVAIGDSTRSATGNVKATAVPSSPSEIVPATGDLGSIGRTIDDYVTSWSASGRRPIVCVDSLFGLVERATIVAVYRFLYVLFHRIERTGGSVHVHADPRRYEEEILRTFFPLFDRVVSFQEGGTLL